MIDINKLDVLVCFPPEKKNPKTISYKFDVQGTKCIIMSGVCVFKDNTLNKPLTPHNMVEDFEGSS